VASDTLIPLGPLVNVHATRGELRLLPYNPGSTSLCAGSQVVLRRGNDRHSCRVSAVRRHKRFVLVTLEGCASMAAAEALVGYEVCLHEADLPPLGANEVYHYELVGMTVVTTAGAEIGRVAEVLTTPSHDICVVRSAEQEHLIPLVGDIVTQVDRPHRRLVIDPPPGLLDP
jgi:16S rRNA processing protein RimM